VLAVLAVAVVMLMRAHGDSNQIVGEDEREESGHKFWILLYGYQGSFISNRSVFIRKCVDDTGVVVGDIVG
jgi:hypothetical protein